MLQHLNVVTIIVVTKLLHCYNQIVTTFRPARKVKVICFPSRCPGSGGDIKREDGGSQSNSRPEEERGFPETLREISLITLVWQPLHQITDKIYRG